MVVEAVEWVEESGSWMELVVCVVAELEVDAAEFSDGVAAHPSTQPE